MKNIQKRLWLLRMYILVLKGLSEILLITYITTCLYVLFSHHENTITNLLLGAGGVYIIISAIGIIITTQIIQLFINIHDDLHAIKIKTFNPQTENINTDTDANSYRGYTSIVIIVLAIIMLLTNISHAYNRLDNDMKVDDTKTEIDNENPFK